MEIKLKSYRLKDTLKRKPKKGKRGFTGKLVIGGVTALIGIGLVSETAKAVSKI